MKGELIINNKNNNSILSEYFDVVSDDVYHTMRTTMGVNNERVVKCVNMSEVYSRMVVDVAEYMQSERYIKDRDDVYIGRSVRECVNMYTGGRYDGLTMEYVDSVVNNKGTSRILTIDRIYDLVIEGAGGVESIDWLSVYENTANFRIKRNDVWMVMINRLLNSELYAYYRDRYNIRNVRITSDYVPGKNERYVLFDYDGGEYKRGLDNLVRNKRQWWRKLCGDNGRNRGGIKDYDLLLNGRSEDVVLPDYCPIFRNIRLNYTQINFSSGGTSRIQRCSEVAGYIDKGVEWAFASIDRIDSNRGYTYDNVRVISDYANLLKNKGSMEQLEMVLEYMKSNR